MPGFKAVIAAVVATLVLAISASGHLVAQDARRYIAPSRASDGAGPPYSGAVLVGNTLYVSGDIGVDETGKVPDTPESEARLLLENIQRTLKQAGFAMDDLVYVTVYCSDVKHYDAFNKVYRTYFKQEFPARAFIGAGTLLFNARFEMQGIAVRR